MRVIIDQNISHRIIPKIVHLFDETAHVRTLGLINAPDVVIFRNAKQQKFDAILTLDEDFENIILQNAPPPKILWLRVRNCSTQHLAEIIKNNIDLINDFLVSEDHDCLEIFEF